MLTLFVLTTLSPNKRTRIERVVSESELFATYSKERTVSLLDEVTKNGFVLFNQSNGSQAMLEGPFFSDNPRLELSLETNLKAVS